jgi:iron complex outermembrane receptor protein
LSERLRLLPGLQVRERQNQAQDTQVSIRGFGARASFGQRGIRVYLDEVPATMPDGQGQWAHALPASIASVRLERGPFAALAGNAAGAVLYLESRAPRGPRFLQLDAGFGADGSRRYGVSGRHGLATGGWMYDLAHWRGEGYRAHSRAERWQAQLRWAGEHGSQDWSLVGNLFHAPDALDPGGLTATEWRLDPRAAAPGALAFQARKRVDQVQLGGRWRWRQEPAQSHLSAYFGRREVDQVLPIPIAAQQNPLHPGGVVSFARHYAGVALLRQGERVADDERHAWRFGLEIQGVDEDRRGYENFRGARLGVRGALRRDEALRFGLAAVHAEARIALRTDLDLRLGGRIEGVHFSARDRYRTTDNPDDSGMRTFTAALPVVGVEWRPGPTHHVQLACGHGYETPTLNELAYRADGSAGFNTELEPARQRQCQATLNGSADGTRYELSLFRIATADEIFVFDNQAGRASFANAGRSRRAGIEFAGQGRFDRHWRWFVSGTVLSARYRDDVPFCTARPCLQPVLRRLRGRALPAVAPRLLSAELDWQGEAGWRGGIELRLGDRYYANDANSAPVAGHAVVDLRFGRRWRWSDGSLDVHLRADNVFDRAYVGSVIVNEAQGRFYEPAPGRQLAFGLRWTWR